MRMPIRDEIATRLWFWSALFTSLAVLGLYAGTAVTLVRYGSRTADLGWLVSQRGHAWFVTKAPAAGPVAACLQRNDRIVAVNGDTRAPFADPATVFERASPGSQYSLDVLRDGKPHACVLRVGEAPNPHTAYWSITLLLSGLVFFAVGTVIGLLKPNDPVARLGFLFTMLCALEMVYQALQPIHASLPTQAYWTYAVVNLITYCLPYAVGYHLASRFPAPLGESPGWVRLRWGIYLACFVAVVPNGVLVLLTALDPQRVVQLYFNHSLLLEQYSVWSFGFRLAFELLAVVASAVVLRRNYSRITEPDLHRRIRWIAYGTAAGLIPVAAHALALSALGVTGSIWLTKTEAWANFTRLTNIAVVAIPLTLGYCVIKHRVLGIDVALRRGLQYLLAKNSLRILLFLPWLSLASNVALHPEVRIRDIVRPDSMTFYAGTTLAAGVSLRYRKQVMQAVDRRFFRDSYDQEQILLELIEEMNEASTVGELSQLVVSRLKASLHPESVRVLYREPGTNELSWSDSNEAEPTPLSLDAESRLIPALQMGRTAFEVGTISPGLLPIDESWLSGLGIHLVTPILGTDSRVLGALCLGDKKSQEPYTRRDRSLLQMIAAQFALEAENLWLRKRVGEEEQVRHDVLAQLGPVQSFIKECRHCGLCFDNHATVCSKDGSELGLSLPVERVLANRYRLDRRLGTGGMGAVYEGLDLRLSRKVAVKVMTGRLFGDRTSLRRFEREAQASARLNHPNIIQIYDFGALGGGGAYMVMEYLPGGNLRAELNRLPVLPAAIAARWMEELLAGVAAAHEAGIIHRDLKPENVLIARPEGAFECVKILDFGVAKMWERLETATITAAGSVVGTLGYMSPEQMTGAAVDERTDVFSLGVIVTEALTGRRPFTNGNPRELLASIYRSELSVENPELRRVLAKCLAPERGSRYASVAQLRYELIPLLRGSSDFVPGRDEQDHGDTSTLVPKLHTT